MSHELRTPLNAIIGFSQLLSSPGHSFPAEKQAGFNAHIHKAGEHLLALIDELMNLARIEAGKLEFDLRRWPLHTLLEECMTMVATQARARGLTINFETPDERIRVVADRTRLKQVLLNLLSNAVKYNRPDGTLTLVAHPLDHERLRIEVSDSGAGLSQDQISHLFEPFNRLGRTKEGPDAVEGTGLGLVVTKHLIELMGGRIGVSSLPGVGTCFWVDLIFDDSPVELSLPRNESRCLVATTCSNTRCCWSRTTFPAKSSCRHSWPLDPICAFSPPATVEKALRWRLRMSLPSSSWTTKCLR
ncbi:MAG: hypothetical protein DI603_17540 [Roseateles depolymerans]|uniref:histidine kinase n=1 Tax=Roseateles depolymerans TaxID=76731 RepID=A0A2W5FEM3_9BURK|nr:MAG: hypothetical protein DI603_17540 [Roseateles depolymerans]